MTLIIEDNSSDTKDFDGTTFRMSSSYLKSKAVHLFIASHKWDKLRINLNDDIDVEALKYITLKVNEVEAIIPITQTITTMKQLSALFPDKANLLRKAFMSGKDLSEVIG